jgi:hypothetical protein
VTEKMATKYENDWKNKGTTTKTKRIQDKVRKETSLPVINIKVVPSRQTVNLLQTYTILYLKKQSRICCFQGSLSSKEEASISRSNNTNRHSTCVENMTTTAHKNSTFTKVMSSLLFNEYSETRTKYEELHYRFRHDAISDKLILGILVV